MKKIYPLSNSNGRFGDQKTNNTVKAINALLKILSYAEKNDPLLFNYLIKNFPLFSVINTRQVTDLSVFITWLEAMQTDICNHIENDLSYMKPIQIDNFYSDIILSLKEKKIAGVYVFIYDGEYVNIGSSINIHQRIILYKDTMHKHERGKITDNFSRKVEQVGGMEKLQFQIVYVTNNYVENYISITPNYIDNVSINILKNFTKFYPRLIEQIYQTYYQPKWNIDRPVIYDFVNWDPASIFAPSGQIKYNIIITSTTQPTQQIHFQSIKSGSEATGIKVDKFKILINTNQEFFAPNYKIMVKITTNHPVNPNWRKPPTPKITTQDVPFDLEAIPIGKVWAVNANTLEFIAEFNNTKQAVTILHTKHNKPRRHLNTTYTFTAGNESTFYQGKYYLFKNPHVNSLRQKTHIKKWKGTENS